MVAYARARIAAIAPEENIPWPDVVAWAELAAKQGSAWYEHVAGLAHLRAGNLDKATEWLEKSATTSWHPELNQIALYLVYHRRGEVDKANENLQQARAWRTTKEAEKDGGYYKVQVTDWLEFNILMREVEETINPKATSQSAVE